MRAQQHSTTATKGKAMRRTKTLMTLLGVAAILAFTGLPARADSAQDNYTAFCAKCHGAGGRGDGPSAGSLATKPQDYTDCAAMQKISDDTMFKVIKGGGASVGLPVTCPAGATGCPTLKFTTWWPIFALSARRNSRTRARCDDPGLQLHRAFQKMPKNGVCSQVLDYHQLSGEDCRFSVQDDSRSR